MAAMLIGKGNGGCKATHTAPTTLTALDLTRGHTTCCIYMHQGLQPHSKTPVAPYLHAFCSPGIQP